MNFLQLAQRLRQETGTSGAGPSTVTNQIGDYKRLVDWINLAYQEIQNKWLDWKFLWAEGEITVVTTTRDYDLPTDCAMLNEDSVYLAGKKLEYVPYDLFRRDKDSWDQPGEPSHFTLLPNDTFRLLPTPVVTGGTVRFEYQRSGMQMVANDDSPLIPPRYHDTIIWRAKMFWAEFEHADAEYRAALQNFQQAMLRLEANQAPTREYAHGRVLGADIVVCPQ
jgi:hypothetical protein